MLHLFFSICYFCLFLFFINSGEFEIKTSVLHSFIHKQTHETPDLEAVKSSQVLLLKATYDFKNNSRQPSLKPFSLVHN